MSFASPDPFSHVEAFFGPANGTGFDRLAINHRSTGLFVSAFFLPHLFEKAFLNLIPDALLAPPPKVVIQRPPGWQVMGDQSPRAPAPQDVENAIDNFAPRVFDMGGIRPQRRDQLAVLLPAQVDVTEEEIRAILDASIPGMGPEVRKNVLDALAIAAYHSQTSYPIVDLLICDDAPQFNWLTAWIALCWIHEFR